LAGIGVSIPHAASLLAIGLGFRGTHVTSEGRPGEGESQDDGERLRGCLGYNRWQVVVTGEWRQLPQDDIAALTGLGSSWPWQRRG
jgi:hypothetical protein